ncbi:MAG: hypothetical protein HYW90_03910 [Candidatus Sungbacteria bacterium]|nr:hypothetical protein [Candidatus Sungbacteria bacterium]
METIVVVLVFAAGIMTGVSLIDRPNGKAVSADTLRPGKYMIGYPYSILNTPIPNADNRYTEFVIYGEDALTIFIAVDKTRLTRKENTYPRQVAHLDVSIKNGKKNFIIYRKPS